MIYDNFLNYGMKRNYIKLEDLPVVRNGKDTFYIGSTAMANLHLFEDLSKRNENYIGCQKTFINKRIDDVGMFPLESSFQVMLSFFRFNDQSTDISLKFLFDYLKNELNIDYKELFFLSPKELDVNQVLSNMNVPATHIINWNESLKLSLGTDRPQGYYLKIFLPYKKGIIPIATMGFIPFNGKIVVDSALYVERLHVIKENKAHLFETSLFTPLKLSIENLNNLSELELEERLIWIHHFRALIALLNDGASFNTKGSGHVVRKMIRKLASMVDQIDYKDVQILTRDALSCLQNIHISKKLSEDTLSSILYDLLDNSIKQITKTRKSFRKFIDKPKENILDENEILLWHSERGLPLNILREELSLHGYNMNFERKHRFRLQQDCYSFDKEIDSKDIRYFLVEAENK